ncbi:hypothetical protein PsorP6_014765 [Peronosclerospora sorghi]|uniref:Uncharacterized protein n=1 Tax=Peronosclerospora sorghi TaxID=230839 RepID=A0ACC0VRI3_9STRA|nr:hypothetical protein PsorP6_014765 [Peronosclerospora sorghi]
MEILKETAGDRPTAILAPVGGGGMIAGIADYAKAVAPDVKIIGVEAEGANILEVSLQQNSRVAFPSVNRFTEEKGLKSLGKDDFRLCKDLVDDVVNVSTDEKCSAIKDVFGDTRSLMEPTDPYNITEFSYRMDSESAKEARIWMSIQTKTHNEFVGVVTAINERCDMHAIDVASNELDKSHLRHLAVGRPENVRSPTVFILIVRRLGLYILLTVIYISTDHERTFVPTGISRAPWCTQRLS